MRFPTMDEMNAALAEQERLERLATARAAQPARAHTEAFVELKALGIDPAAPVVHPPMSPVVDVMREPLPPRAPEPLGPPAPATDFYCGVCGKVFSVKQYKTAGMAKMQRTKHAKRAHDNASV
jgi:hypothetical protein